MEELNAAFLSLGANLGQREDQINQAIWLMNNEGIRVIGQSRFFYSKAMGYESNYEFCNVAIKVLTAYNPITLLNVLKKIERNIGRLEKSTFGQYQDRLIDIDIIFFNNLSFNDDQLTIPHPFWAIRPFVYIPILELIDRRLI